MKTIQQVIKNASIEDIIEDYFLRYPLNIHDIPEAEANEITVKAYKEHAEGMIRKLVERLSFMDLKKNVKKLGILFVCKMKGFDSSYERDIELIYLDELMSESDLSKVQDYGYEYVEQDEALTFLVADTALTQINLMSVIVSFLHETTFWGFEQECLKDEIERLDEVIKDLEEHPEKAIKISDDELFDEVEEAVLEKYPGEKEFLTKCDDANREYNKYCRNIELSEIKKSIVAIGDTEELHRNFR